MSKSELESMRTGSPSAGRAHALLRLWTSSAVKAEKESRREPCNTGAEEESKEEEVRRRSHLASSMDRGGRGTSQLSSLTLRWVPAWLEALTAAGCLQIQCYN